MACCGKAVAARGAVTSGDLAAAAADDGRVAQEEAGYYIRQADGSVNEGDYFARFQEAHIALVASDVPDAVVRRVRS